MTRARTKAKGFATFNADFRVLLVNAIRPVEERALRKFDAICAKFADSIKPSREELHHHLYHILPKLEGCRFRLNKFGHPCDGEYFTCIEVIPEGVAQTGMFGPQVTGTFYGFELNGSKVYAPAENCIF